MAFTKLPLEINTHIASYLPSDRSVARFALICRDTHAAVTHPHCPIWRTRFNQAFDLFPGVPNDVLKAVYQRRMSLLRKGVSFVKGTSLKEKAVLTCLRDLILEAYSGLQGEHHVVARNIQVIQRVCCNHDLLQNVLAPRFFDKQTSPLIITLQVILTHLRFSLDHATRTFSFDDAQQTVYRIPEKELMFTGKNRTEVNMRWVLHATTFFKHYMTTPSAALADAYEGLANGQRIQPWKENVSAGVMAMGKHWKGAYAYLKHDEILTVRDGSSVELEDRWCDAPEVFQTLDLDFADQLFAEKKQEYDTAAHHHHQQYSAPQMPWPNLFERHLRSRDHPSVHAMRKAQSAAFDKAAGSNRARVAEQNMESSQSSQAQAKGHSRTSSTVSTVSSIFSSSSTGSSQTDASSVTSDFVEIKDPKAGSTRPVVLKQQTIKTRVTKPTAKKSPQLKLRTPSPPALEVRKPTRAIPRGSVLAMMSLKSPTAPRATRAQSRVGKELPSPLTSQTHLPRSKLDITDVTLERQFQACGLDEEDFLAAGFVTALPHQQGIPGWARFTMMKFFGPDDDYHNLDDGIVPHKPPFKAELFTGTDGLWAYEGVMLPGARVIVGRWWSPETEGRDHGAGVGLGMPGGVPGAPPGDDYIYSGPFMFWCVDE